MEEKLKKLGKLKNTNIVLFIILIVGIIIIGVEISICNNNTCKNEIHGDALDDIKYEIQRFNANLEYGIGTNVTGIKVITMIDNAVLMLKDNPNLKLTINDQNTIDSIEEIKTEIRKTTRYIVEAEKDESGRINKIKIIGKTREVISNDKTN